MEKCQRCGRSAYLEDEELDEDFKWCKFCIDEETEPE